MTYRIRWSSRASNDIDAITNYIAKDSKRSAKRVASYIRAAAQPLAQFPRLGRAVEGEGVRELILPRYPYVLVYALVEREVRILAVYHQAQNRP